MQQCNGFRDVDLDVDMVHWLQTSITRCRHIPMANRHAALAIRTNLNSHKFLVRFLKFLTFLYPSYPTYPTLPTIGIAANTGTGVVAGAGNAADADTAASAGAATCTLT